MLYCNFYLYFRTNTSYIKSVFRRNYLTLKYSNANACPMYYKGIYHFFYQHNPYGAVFGKTIVWGHSASYDLINWIHLNNALSPTNAFDAKSWWSGSITILPGQKPVVLYTGLDVNNQQVQNMAMPKNEVLRSVTSLSNVALTDIYYPNLFAAINSLYVALGSPLLPGWVGVGVDPCADGWQGVQCIDSNITSIIFNAANLGEELGDNLGLFASIRSIDFSGSQIGGNIPSSLPVTLQNLYAMRVIYIAKGSPLLPPAFASIFDDSASSSLDVFFIHLAA